jgi:hypothetical protein
LPALEVTLTCVPYFFPRIRQGGPGTSGFLGMFDIVGPYGLDENDALSERAVTWNQEFAMIFVDNPVCVVTRIVLPHGFPVLVAFPSLLSNNPLSLPSSPPSSLLPP